MLDFREEVDTDATVALWIGLEGELALGLFDHLSADRAAVVSQKRQLGELLGAENLGAAGCAALHAADLAIDFDLADVEVLCPFAAKVGSLAHQGANVLGHALPQDAAAQTIVGEFLP
jgi:hypothetical protein